MRDLTVFLLCSISALASTVTAGRGEIFSGDIPGLQVNLTGPGLQVSIYDNTHLPSGGVNLPPYCTGVCTFDYSQPNLVFQDPSTKTVIVDGVTYSGVIVSATMAFASSAQTATADCGIFCPPGRPLWVTVWPTASFTMTGTLRMYDPATSSTVARVISGIGVAAAEAHFAPPADMSNFKLLTFQFDAPEPAPLGVIAITGLAVFASHIWRAGGARASNEPFGATSVSECAALERFQR